MNFVGIDIGTTSICGIVFDTYKKSIIKSVTLPNNSFLNSEKPFEKIQDTEIIMNTVYNILGQLLESNVAAIGFSGQMHGIVYTDENGNAVSPLFTWQDERAAMEYSDEKSYAQHLGCFAGYGLATDFYNEINDLIPNDAKYICTIADYAVMKLCGLNRPVIHITNAASLGCFDIEKNCFNIINTRLPEVTSEFKAVGNYNGIPVCVALGDNQASFIGSVSDVDNALINIGTGSQISWLSKLPVVADGVENRPFDGNFYLAAGCALCGGRAFAMVEKLFREIANLVTDTPSFYSYIDKLLESKTETTLSADCRFCGTRNDPAVRGGIFNISENNFTAGDIALSVLTGMSDELYQMYKNGGKQTAKLVCSGNGIRKNKTLRRVVSEMFCCEIMIPLFEEEASFGAALAATVAVGYSKNIFDACNMITYRGE